MRIGVDIRCLLENQYSGISEYTFNLLDHLIRLDRENDYILFYNTARTPRVPKLSGPNVTIRGFSYPNKIFNLAIRLFRVAAVDRMIGGVDLFLTPNYLFLHLSGHPKKVLVVHDISFALYPEFFTFKKRLWHRLINPKKMTQEADVVIAISESTKRDLMRVYSIAEEKIQVVYPGISDRFFAPINPADQARVRSRYNLPERFVLYLGNLEPRKNIDGVIAAAELPGADWTLVVAGAEGWKYHRMYAAAQRLQRAGRIKFLGYVDQNDKPALYSLASVFVYPSIYEGFGLPPIEAMACGAPVVCSHSSSLPEAVGDAAVMVDPYNSAAIGTAIDQILSDSRLSERLIEHGRRRAQEFRWEPVARRFIEIFASLKN